MAVHAVLNELNQPVKLVLGMENGKKMPELLKVNPRGQVPVLEDEGIIIREGAAMIIYLCDKHKQLIPASGKERAKALEWLMFGNATLHPAYSKVFGLLKGSLPEETKNLLMKSYIEAINKLWVEVDEVVAKQKYITGDNITAADFLLAVIANWLQTAKVGIQLGSNVQRYVKDVSSLPSFQKALKAESVEYKAAA